MRNLPQKIQLLANIAIILASILLAGLAVKRFILPTYSKPDSLAPPPITASMKLSLPGVDWGKGDRTLLMVLSTNCHFCTESAPFYQRLAQQKVGRADVRLVASLPQTTAEAQKYLADHGVTVDEVRQSTPGATYTQATPTLILVDKTGSVISSWVGKLTTDKEGEVLERFLGQPN